MRSGSSRRLMRSPMNFGTTAITFSLRSREAALLRASCASAGAQFLGGVLHRLDDVLVASASAEISLERVTDFRVGRIRVAAQQIGRGHDHAGRAVPALEAMLLPEAVLERV